jgi:pimeloyl-ACP methyl ester carboxylesterase
VSVARIIRPLVVLATLAVISCGRPTLPESGEPVMLTATSRDGTPIAFHVSGNGPPVVLVHGTTADHSRWARVKQALEGDFTIHAIDRRGRGGSGDAPDYFIEREFEDIAAVVDAIDEPVILLGHSYGALCSMEAALLTDNIRRLILYEPPLPTGAPIYDHRTLARIQQLADMGLREEATTLFFREVVRMPDHEFEVYSKLSTWRVRVALAGTIARELALDKGYMFAPERFSQLDVPTLLLVGGDSPPLFQQAIGELEKALPDSRTVTLEGQQHVAMDTDLPGFLEAIRPFMN